MPGARSTFADLHGNIHDPCTLFKLPPELRYQIYELAFLPDTSDPLGIDLLAAEVPGRELLQTCRAIYNQAANIYKQTFRDYWSSHTFFIDNREDDTVADRLSSLSEEDVEHIRHFILVFYYRSPAILARATYTKAMGTWRGEGFAGTHTPDPFFKGTTELHFDAQRARVVYVTTQDNGWPAAERVRHGHRKPSLKEQILTFLEW